MSTPGRTARIIRQLSQLLYRKHKEGAKVEEDKSLAISLQESAKKKVAVGAGVKALKTWFSGLSAKDKASARRQIAAMLLKDKAERAAAKKAE